MMCGTYEWSMSSTTPLARDVFVKKQILGTKSVFPRFFMCNVRHGRSWIRAVTKAGLKTKSVKTHKFTTTQYTTQHQEHHIHTNKYTDTQHAVNATELMFLSICLVFRQCVCPSVCLSGYPSVCLFVSLSVCPFVVSICLFLSASVKICLCLFSVDVRVKSLSVRHDLVRSKLCAPVVRRTNTPQRAILELVSGKSEPTLLISDCDVYGEQIASKVQGLLDAVVGRRGGAANKAVADEAERKESKRDHHLKDKWESEDHCVTHLHCGLC